MMVFSFGELNALSYGENDEDYPTLNSISVNIRLAFVFFYLFLFFLLFCNCCVIVYYSVKAYIVKIEPDEEDKKYFFV
uniref:Ion transport domain-containing protein n=1 Tax=Strongyloides stercoralis TaxID=6248 RepID=A0A0K0EB31_STRER